MSIAGLPIAGGPIAGLPEVGTTTQTLTATKLTNVSTFGTHVLASGAAPLVATVLANTSTFGTHVLNASFPATATTLVNTSTFGTHVLEPGASPLVATILVNQNSFGIHVLTGGTPTVTTGPTPAGKSRKPSKRKKKPVLVTIDGQDFVVQSEYEAEELVTQARAVAEQKAKAEAEEIVRKRKAKAAKDGRLNTNPLRLEEPKVSVTPANDGKIDQAWVNEVERVFNDSINQAYQQAAQDAEIELLMLKQVEIDEEDTLVALLLTI